MPNLANFHYTDRINRAIDYVTKNLAEPLSLEDVANVACFSTFHFHRIFRAQTGETLAQFIKRLRLERAVYLLSHRPSTSLTQVALACGFSSSSDFSRSFRSHFGIPPRMFDVALHRGIRREEMAATLATSAGPSESVQSIQALATPGNDNPDGFAVRFRDVPARRVAYVRVHNPYAGGGVSRATQTMLTWARERGLAEGQWLGYQWDDPEIVALDRCRYDVGVEIPDGVVVDGEVSVTELAPMKLAEVDVAGSIDLELRAFHWLYRRWLPTSGFAPDHQPCFEAWNGEPFAHGSTHFELRIQLAVVDVRIPL